MVIAFVVAAVVLGISYCCYWVAFYNPERRHAEPVPMPRNWKSGAQGQTLRSLHRQMCQTPSEQIVISSHDGLKLGGRYYHLHDGAMLQIQFHGYRGCGERDLCGLHQLAREMGHNILVVSQRAGGASEGNTITFGIKEKHDCLAWAKYAAERFGTDIPMVLAGVSMGAATVMMAAGEQLPENVIGILADCGYTSAKEIMFDVMRKMKLPPKLCYPFVKLGAKLFGHFDPDENSPLEAMKRCTLPVIFFHGEDDDFVPCSMSRANFEACAARKKLVTIPGAGHGLSYAVQPQRYLQELRDFFGPESSYPE